MSKSVERVKAYFVERGLPVQVRELGTSTRTAQLAAEAVGCELGQIVKSLVLVAGGRPVLALVAGDRRADPAKIARAAGAASARIANAEEVRAFTGFAIGGVAPVAHVGEALSDKLMDESLGRFETLWAAAGAPNALFEIGREKLVELSGARAADITEEVVR